jgi:hypothetical protein
MSFMDMFTESVTVRKRGRPRRRGIALRFVLSVDSLSRAVLFGGPASASIVLP